MVDITDVLTEESIIAYVTNPDGSVVVSTEECGPAPNPVEVFADHSSRGVEQINCTKGNPVYKIEAAR
jgi:hypothetical protein